MHSWTKETLQYKNIDKIFFFYRRNIFTLYQCLPGWIDYTGKVRFVWNSLERYVIEHSRIHYFRAKCHARAGDVCHVCTQLTAVGIRSKKNNLFFPICSSKLQNIMPRLDNAGKERAIGMLQLGATQGDVARRFRMARNTIWRLWNRHRTTDSTADRPRSDRPRVTNNRQYRLIRLRACCHSPEMLGIKMLYFERKLQERTWSIIHLKIA